MKLERIITMANKRVEIEFRAMERSLRATGCKLPIWVIPFNDQFFDLPEGSTWWVIPELHQWLAAEGAMPKLRKYQCFLTANYQFVDADVCFLRNPEQVLSPYDGFITSCLHWSNPDGTYTADSLQYMKERTTNWPSLIFNSGQFASSIQLYDLAQLREMATRPNFRYTCIELWRDQPSINMMVFASGVQIQNLTLPPYNMQSTWAGDYNHDYQGFWQDEEKKPYLIHWAGLKPGASEQKRRKIDEIFIAYLNAEELGRWKEMEQLRAMEAKKQKMSIRYYGRKLKRACQVLMN